MGNDLTLADFAKVAGTMGFTDQEFSRLFKTENVGMNAAPDKNQKATFDKVLSLAVVCGDNWLDGPHRFRAGPEFATKTAREIIMEPDGLDRYILAVENAAGGPLPFRP